MGKHTFAILTAGLLVLALPTRALPSEEASEDILITDPALLERMGLDADATNVYATPQVLEYLLMEPQEGEHHARVQSLHGPGSWPLPPSLRCSPTATPTITS